MNERPIRLWPGVAIVIAQWIVAVGVPILIPGAAVVGMMGAAAGGLAIVVWWLFFSRAPWVERVGALAVVVVAIVGAKRIVHPSIAGGAMGMLIFVLGIAPLSLGLVLGVAAGRRLATVPRRVAMVVAILIGCGSLSLIRTGGISGGGASDLHWRWTKTPEELLLARAGDASVALPQAVDSARDKPDAPLTATPPPGAAEPGGALPGGAKPDGGRVSRPGPTPTRPAEWPGFRGPNRDGVVRGVTIKTDWAASPPVQIWHRPIGPGWSSFAVDGDRFYTQEQRGDDEIVACYRMTTGEPVWSHRDKARFYESNGGPGPRATPTLSDGRVYTFGATGILNALDEGTGAVIWSRQVATDADKKVPMWGFTSSPLIEGDVVIVAASGKLVGYDIATGTPRWFGPARLGSYSSPHHATIDGVVQVLLLTASGVTSVAPATGAVLWEHTWTGEGTTIVQPAVTEDGGVLINSISTMGGVGIRRLAVARGPAGWKVEERWTSTGLKPYFNDFVVHHDHAYGFDGSILSCIDLADGTRKWKGGRYGNGQIMLLADQDVLLVTSEDGELALVKATPDQFTELATFPALEGKTWNHPVLVGDVLLVRNGEEMAAFRLPLAGK